MYQIDYRSPDESSQSTSYFNTTTKVRLWNGSNVYTLFYNVLQEYEAGIYWQIIKNILRITLSLIFYRKENKGLIKVVLFCVFLMHKTSTSNVLPSSVMVMSQSRFKKFPITLYTFFP